MIFEGCLDSNPEYCRSKLARYRLVKILIYFDGDPGQKKFGSEVREKHPGSEVREKHPGSATLTEAKELRPRKEREEKSCYVTSSVVSSDTNGSLYHWVCGNQR
jgi:hypothetical protein